MDDDGLQEQTRAKSRRRAPRRTFATPDAALRSAGLDPETVEFTKVEVGFLGEDGEPWDEQAERERRELYAELAPRRRQTAGIPTRWHGITFDEFEPAGREEAIAAGAAWGVGRGARGLMFYGEVGRGKTRIAAAAAWARCALGPVRWRNVAELLMALGYGFGHPAREKALEHLQPRAGTALVLDDLDKTKPSEHALQPLYLAINSFVEAQLPLIVTCQRDPDALADDFGERFGEPIASRLAGYCATFEVTGADRRLI